MSYKFNEKELCQAPSLNQLHRVGIRIDDRRYITTHFEVEVDTNVTKMVV